MFPDERKIRVLAHADSRIFSGAESLFCDVVNGLSGDDRFEVVASAPPENPDLTAALADAADSGPVPVSAQPLRLAAFHLYDPRRILASRKAMTEVDPDVVFLNLPSPEYGATPLLAGLDHEVPILGLVHITAGMKEHGFRFGGARELLSRRALRRLDRACVVSDAAAGSFHEQWGSKDRHPALIRLREPAVTPESRELSRHRLGLPSDAGVIGIAGRLTAKQKGHDTLIEASVEMLRDRPDLIFVVAGDGPDLAMLEEQARSAGVSTNWRFLGAVRPLDSFYGAIDLIAIPSRFEGLPLVALEAIEAGVPGVASAVDGLADVWPADWRVLPDAPDALADRLAGLLEADPEELDSGIVEARQRMNAHVTADPSDDVSNLLAGMVSHA
ncbi:MAG: glycosyltransferase family 4 protein [Solirubrobacterales bacterium]|nr:glycosyltransferase family 4 protein [Solirubrobacterales bacterium]HMT05439.1 glycosyltransferase family 4 protein [Solirubrobacterales bacterium]